MASFPGGVVILTAFGDDHQPRGLTVSAFCAASLDPPLALVCIDKKSNTLPAVQHTGGVHRDILGPGRDELPGRTGLKMSDNFGGIAGLRPGSKIRVAVLQDDTAALAALPLRGKVAP